MIIVPYQCLKICRLAMPTICQNAMLDASIIPRAAIVATQRWVPSDLRKMDSAKDSLNVWIAATNEKKAFLRSAMATPEFQNFRNSASRACPSAVLAYSAITLNIIAVCSEVAMQAAISTVKADMAALCILPSRPGAATSEVFRGVMAKRYKPDPNIKDEISA